MTTIKVLYITVENLFHFKSFAVIEISSQFVVKVDHDLLIPFVVPFGCSHSALALNCSVCYRISYFSEFGCAILPEFTICGDFIPFLVSF